MSDIAKNAANTGAKTMKQADTPDDLVSRLRVGGWVGELTAYEAANALEAAAERERKLVDEARRQAFIEAWDAVRGTNADMCKTPQRAYQICVEAARLKWEPTALKHAKR